MSRDRRQSDFYSWAVEVFGTTASNREERASRFLEEAIELAHALDLDRDRVNALVARVYRSPVGAINREVGQVGVTLLALCERLGLSADTEELREWARVTSASIPEMRARHRAKADQGIALPIDSGVGGEA